jgi:hypothetical protein
MGTTDPASAQNQVCAKRDRIVKQLETVHGETRRSAGLQNNSSVVEVFASEKGSWTIFVTMPTGVSCLIAVGEAWETDLLPDEPSKSSLKGDPV